MKSTRDIMGMPITVEIVDSQANPKILESVFDYLTDVDNRFSTYKESSEVSRINRGEIPSQDYSADMQEILGLAEQTKRQTGGYFEVRTPKGKLDPSGIVKGWAVFGAARLLQQQGLQNFYVEAGGDIQVSGRNAQGQPWTVGIRNPFKREEIVKIIRLSHEGIATSGTYIRGQHIYNPFQPLQLITEIVSLTVIGPNVYEADRFATAAFAMGKEGIYFLENLEGFEGYMIDSEGVATQTTGFNRYVTTR